MVEMTVDNTLGSLQIGVITAVFLFGVVTLQFETYLHQFWEDGWVIRTMACSVGFLELVHTFCIAAEAYTGTITFYGRLTNYGWYPWMGGATLTGGLITVIVQCFFSYRTWKALPNPLRYVGPACGITAIVRGVGSTYLGSQVIMTQNLVEYRNANAWLIRVLLALGMSVDIIIAASMLYFLLKNRNSGFGATTRLVDHLVAYTIRTGLLTSVTSVVVLATFQAAPHTFIWVGAYVVLAKLYSNSLFAALNSRRGLRAIVAQGSSERPRHQASSGSRILQDRHHDHVASSPAINIKMDTMVACDADSVYTHADKSPSKVPV